MMKPFQQIVMINKHKFLITQLIRSDRSRELKFRIGYSERELRNICPYHCAHLYQPDIAVTDFAISKVSKA